MSENVKPGSTPGRASSVRLSSLISWSKGRKTKTNNLQRIQNLIADLDVIYDKIEDQTSALLDPSTYDDLSIKCEELRLNADGSYKQPVPEPCFFNPLSPNVCRALPINSEKMEDDYRSRYDSLNERFERYSQGKSDLHQGLISLCYEMNWEFNSYPRIGTKDDGRKLRSHLAKWRPAGYVCPGQQLMRMESKLTNAVSCSLGIGLKMLSSDRYSKTPCSCQKTYLGAPNQSTCLMQISPISCFPWDTTSTMNLLWRTKSTRKNCCVVNSWQLSQRCLPDWSDLPPKVIYSFQ